MDLQEVGHRRITQGELSRLRILRGRVMEIERDILLRVLEGADVEPGALEAEIRTNVCGGRRVQQLIVR
jgi:cobalamin biosynthesis Mg chelatase CobN